jgi:hypothetical protein
MVYDDNDHTREVCANFGLTICCAQVLEHGVVNLILAKIFPDPAATREMFAPVMEQHFAQVLGRLDSAVADSHHEVTRQDRRPLVGTWVTVRPNCVVAVRARRPSVVTSGHRRLPARAA